MTYFIFLGFIAGFIIFLVFYIIFWGGNKVKKKYSNGYSNIIGLNLLNLRTAYIEVGLLLGFCFFYSLYTDGFSPYIYSFIFPFIFYILGIKVFFLGQKK